MFYSILGRLQSEAPYVQQAEEGDEEYHRSSGEDPLRGGGCLLAALPHLQRPLQDRGQAQGVLRDQSLIPRLHRPGGAGQARLPPRPGRHPRRQGV